MTQYFFVGKDREFVRVPSHSDNFKFLYLHNQSPQKCIILVNRRIFSSIKKSFGTGFSMQD